MQLFSLFKVSIHPSHSVMIPNLGEDEAEILGQVKSHFLIPSLNPPVWVLFPHFYSWHDLGWSPSTDPANHDWLGQCEARRPGRDCLGWKGLHLSWLIHLTTPTPLYFKGLEVSIVPFLTMNHGFLTRGDMADPDVAAEVQNIHTNGKMTLEWDCTRYYLIPRCPGPWMSLWTSLRNKWETSKQEMSWYWI